MRIWRDIERLLGVYTGGSGCCDIPHRVATGFAQRHVVRSQLRPQLRCLIQADIMDLYILARREVEIAASVLIRNGSNLQQLLERDFTKRQLDADHLYAGLALTIHTARQSQGAKLLLGNLSRLVRTDLLLQFNDLLFYDRILQFCPKTLHILFL